MMVEAKPLVVQVVEACNSRQIRTARAVFIMPVVDAESPTLFALKWPLPSVTTGRLTLPTCRYSTFGLHKRRNDHVLTTGCYRHGNEQQEKF